MIVGRVFFINTFSTCTTNLEYNVKMKQAFDYHAVQIVTLAQKVNNSILHTFQEKQKMFYLFLLSTYATVINCFQMSFLNSF